MNNENSEINNNIPQPDPAWDYYILWHELQRITAKINLALKLIGNKEIADQQVDKQIKQILQPTGDELTSIIDRLPYDDDEEEE